VIVVAQTDGHAGYGHLDDASGIVHIGCWSHVRRKFMDALKKAGKNRKKAAQPGKKQSVAEAGLRFLQDLYLIERSVADASIETRLQVRKEKSLPIVAKLRVWLCPGSTPRSPRSRRRA